MLRFVLSIVAFILATTPSLAEEFTMSAEDAHRRANAGCQIHPVNDMEQMSDACKTLLAIRLLESVRGSKEYGWIETAQTYLDAREREGGDAPTSQIGDELYEHVVSPEPEVSDTREPEDPGTCAPEPDEPFYGYVMRASYEET